MRQSGNRICKSIVLIFIMKIMIFNSYANNCELPSSKIAFDSIAIEIEYINNNSAQIESNKTSYAYSKLEGKIENDDPHFWKTLLINNVQSCSLRSLLSEPRWTCGCAVMYTLEISLCSKKDKSLLEFNSCDIYSRKAYLRIGKNQYELEFHKRIEDSLKDYITKLLKRVIPEACATCAKNN
jgi:hypothetical protein